MTVAFVTLTSAFGVEMNGWDPRYLDPEDASLFRKAFADHGLVLIRDCELSEDQNVALTETLGAVFFASSNVKGARKFSHVSNVHADGTLREGAIPFHADYMFMECPHKALSLYAM